MKKLVIFQRCSEIDNPREWSNLGILAYKSRNYCLGDELVEDPVNWLEDMLGISRSGIHTNGRIYELESLFLEAFVAIPVWKYEHSGVTIQAAHTNPFHCPWDSGLLGYIYTTKERMRDAYGVKKITKKVRARALEALVAEVETFDQYLRGEVYGYEIRDEEDNHIESCSGFFGDNWEENGLKDHIPEELWPQLDNIEVEYDY